jgi:phosphinothricin acetyltransferase
MLVNNSMIHPEKSTTGEIREAQESDAASILAIYAPHIRDSAVTFEVDVPSLGEMSQRIREYRKLGFYVFERDGRVVGYAYGSKHRERSAYQWCCEVSVYVADDCHGQGIASKLYTKLFEALRARGLVNAYAGVTLPNSKSIALHKALGFKSVGVYPKIGFKMGAWHDVEWLGLQLIDHPDSPIPLK